MGAGITLEDYLRGRFRDGSAEHVAYRVARYVAWSGGEAAAREARYADVLRYVAELRSRGLHPRTLRLELAGVSAYHAWLCETGARADHPCRTMRLADAYDRRVRTDELYAADEIARWARTYRAAKACDQRRGEVVVGLLANQALTAGDVARLRLGDVDLEAGTVFVSAGGKTAERTLNLRASQVMTLWRYLDEDRGRYVAMARGRGLRDGWLLFDTRGDQLVGGQLHRLVNVGRAEADRLKPQRIRQSVIAHLVAAGHDLRVVQAFAGHRSSTATAEYRRSDAEELAEAVACLHPRAGPPDET